MTLSSLISVSTVHGLPHPMGLRRYTRESIGCLTVPASLLNIYTTHRKPDQSELAEPSSRPVSRRYLYRAIGTAL